MDEENRPGTGMSMPSFLSCAAAPVLTNPKNVEMEIMERDDYKWVDYIKKQEHLLQVKNKKDNRPGMWKKQYPMDINKALGDSRELFRLHHPNVARIQDAYMVKEMMGAGSLTTVYDYMAGEKSLLDEIERRTRAGTPMKEQTVMEYFAQIVLTFKEVHKLPKVHQNICAGHFAFKTIEHYGQLIKLISWGIERDTFAFEGKTWRGDPKPTLWSHHGAYLPPEFL